MKASRTELLGGLSIIRPDWEVPAGVAAACTTRVGGVSEGPWQGLNLGDHVDDDPDRVAQNRRLLEVALGLPSPPAWLKQVHGTEVRRPGKENICADACYEDRPGRVCAVLTADCLPVLFCSDNGIQIAAAHAGWRGLLAGVLEQTVQHLSVRPAEIQAWLGPAIGPDAFEVGDEVREAFVGQDTATAGCFRAQGPGHWLADLYALARYRLGRAGIERISGGEFCTYSDALRFYSYRRDGITGRMATLIWRES